MTHKGLLGALLIITSVGCSNVADNVGGGTVDESDRQSVGMRRLQERVKQIEIGMNREAVDNILRDISSKSGTWVKGGTGRLRRYYEIDNQQITVDFDLFGRVETIGGPSRLEEWGLGIELDKQEDRTKQRG